jgi:hypothetical protein
MMSLAVAESGKAAAPPTKNAISYDASRITTWSEKQIVDFYKSALDSKSYACFGFIRNGKLEQHNNGCFGMMHTYGIENANGWAVALKYQSMPDFDGVPSEAHRWYTERFMLNLKYSPWRSLVQHMVIVRNAHGVPIVALLDDTVNKVETFDKGLLQNFNIACRQPFDRPDLINQMYAFYKSGMVNKREALLLCGMFSVSPITGLISAGRADRISTSFIRAGEWLRFLEGTPNSSMAGAGRRKLPINQTMSSDNDRYVWGADGRSMSKLNTFLAKPVKGKPVTTFFGLKVDIIAKKDVEAWVTEFRALVKEALAQPDKGIKGVQPPADPYDDDNGDDDDGL